MSAIVFPATRHVCLQKVLLMFTALLASASLIACGGIVPLENGQFSGFGTSPGPSPAQVIANNCDAGTFNGNAATPTANPFFDMHINGIEPGTPWPGSVVLPDPSATVQFAGIRLWDTGTGWAEINRSAGVCDFSHMDAWLTEAQTNNVDILYNLGRTPNWASSNPTDASCAYANIDGGDGQCDPPLDLNSDGTGSDSVWIGWVTSVVSRYKGQIKFYEIWNEWNIALFWTGTTQQLVRMTQDARCIIEGPPPGAACNPGSTFPNGTGIDPAARISTPAPVGAQNYLTAVQTNMSNFLQSQVGGVGPGNFVDIIGFHCYVSTQVLGDYPVPEDVLQVISGLNGILSEFPEVQGEPVFCTEGGWGEAETEGFTDPTLQAAFLARYYLLQNSTNVARVYWYVWDNPSNNGSLWSPAGPTPAATAYAEVYKWMTGATLSSRCSPLSGSTVFTCGYTRGSYQALAVWDSNVAGNGAGGSACYTAGAPACSTFTIPSQYTLYRDLSGNETPVPGPTIALSAEPILLETSSLP